MLQSPGSPPMGFATLATWHQHAERNAFFKKGDREAQQTPETHELLKVCLDLLE